MIASPKKTHRYFACRDTCLPTSHPCDVQAYWDFIKQQEQAAETERGYIHPTPDCVIRTSIQYATGAEIPALPNAPDTGALRQAPRGAKLLINVCSCDRVAPPTLPDGRSVLGHAPNTPYRPSGPSDAPLHPPSEAELAHYELSLTLHTAVGDARGVSKNSTPEHGSSPSDAVVVDIVFHPWVAQRRAASSQLREAMLDFVIGTVEDACAVKLQRPGKYVAATYRGWAHAPGPTPESPPLTTTWPFWLDAKARSAAEKGVKGGFKPMCLWSKPKPPVTADGSSTLTTSDVLNAVKGTSGTDETLPSLPLPSKSPKQAAEGIQARPPVIEEVSATTTSRDVPLEGVQGGVPAWCHVQRCEPDGLLKVLLDLHALPAGVHSGTLEVGYSGGALRVAADGLSPPLLLTAQRLAEAIGVPAQNARLDVSDMAVKRSLAKGKLVIKGVRFSLSTGSQA